MFRVGAFVSVVLVLSLFFGCGEKTSEAQLTGLELGFMNCITFSAQVFIDNDLVGSFSSDRASFIGVAAGTHTLYVQANNVMFDSTFSWTQSFGVAEGRTTYINLNCKTVSATVSDVQVDKTKVVANGIDSVTVTVTVRDWIGNPISGYLVTIESTGGSNTITQPVGLTGANGVAVGLVRSTEAELDTISARADGTLIRNTRSVTFVAGAFSAEVSDVQVDKTTVVADGVDAVTVTVTVTDALGNPIKGSLVTIESTGGSNTITQPVGLTGADGVAVGLVRSTEAELKTVSARAGGVLITNTRNVTFTADAFSARRSRT